MDLVIITFVVTIVFFIIYKYDIFKSLATRGVIEKDFSQCYILSYPKRAELHNKGEIYQIKDLDEFFELNPKLKGKIPVEKRQGIDSSNPDALKKELEERKRLKEKYSKKKKKK
ncbi:hypothetical protein O8C79_07615 [Aliarcobacter butzleri]|uniref:hypothetical protein n=1 Tax=Aliarcobacter butzleri TaxID=28197 RepID=UPI00263CD371|nr:hypothetical protein [Aliarcobacter butzleri]MDN5105154.1 hypothetical protein [Aliarcobacter butzleri]